MSEKKQDYKDAYCAIIAARRALLDASMAIQKAMGKKHHRFSKDCYNADMILTQIRKDFDDCAFNEFGEDVCIVD